MDLNIIDRTGSKTVSALATVTLLTINIPPKTPGKITTWTNSADSSGWGNLVWNTYINGQLVADLAGIKDQYGSLVTRRLLGRPVHYRGGDVITITATNEDGSNTHTAGVSIIAEPEG